MRLVLICAVAWGLATAGPLARAAEPDGGKGEWPQYRGNSGFTGAAADDSVRPPLKLLWSYRTDGDTSGDAGAGVTVAGGMVFVPMANTGSVLALDALSGKLRWEYAHRDFSACKAPAWHEGRLYVWATNWGRSTVVALDAANGRELWTKSLAAKGVAGFAGGRDGLAAADGRVYCGAGGDEPAILALDGKTGNVLWRRGLGTEDGVCAVTPSVAGGLVFTGTRAKDFGATNNTRGSTVALDAATGEILWRVKTASPFRPVASDGRIAAVGTMYSGDKTHVFDTRTGALLWSATTGGAYKGPAILPDMILAKPYGNGIAALDRKTGKALWSFDGKGGTGCCPPSVSGSFAYYGTGCPTGDDSEAPLAWSLTDAPREKGVGWTLKAVDLRTGKEAWSFGTGDNVCGEPAIAYGRLYANSRDGRVYCFAPAKEGEPAVPEARDKSPNASAEEVRKLLAAEPAEAPRPGRDWPMQGGGPERAGIEGVALKLPLAAAWKFDAGGRVLTAPAIRNGRVFFGSDSGKVFALDAAGGGKLWEFQTGEKVRCSPAVAGGVVYCGSDDGGLYALDAASGQKKWTFECGGPVQASPAVAGGVLVFGANDHHTYALDRATGRKLWSFRSSYYSHQAPPVVHGDRVFAAQWTDWVRALDLATGKELWKSYVPITAEALAYHRDKLYLRTPYYVMEYDPASGKRLRMGGAACGYGGMAFLKGLLYNSGIKGQYGTDGGTCLDLDAPGGEPKKIPSLEDVRLIGGKGLLGTPYLAAMGTPLALGDTLCFATVAGEVIITAPDGKKLWTAKLGGTCHAPPVAADGLLVVGCDDGRLYAFRGK